MTSRLQAKKLPLPIQMNYHKELEKIIGCLSYRPKLLLHSCCAPCSSYCLIYLREYFDVTCLYYNPNITDREEYAKRLAELHRLAELLGGIEVIDGDYEPDRFLDEVRKQDLAGCPEGGVRCAMCFYMRLAKTYEVASAGGFEYFTTTLTISPHKNAETINRIGMDIAKDGKVMWLPSDFKKNDGYKRSIELSAQYDLYRQNYCGCIYSKEGKHNENDLGTTQ